MFDGFLAGMLDDICGTDLFNGVLNTLDENLFSSSGTFSPVLNIVRTIYDDVVTPIAIMLIIMYFLLHVIEKLTSENFTWEQLAREICMLLVGKFMIEYGFEILEVLFSLGLNVLNNLSSTFGGPGSTTAAIDGEALLNTFKESRSINGILGDMMMIAYLLFPRLLSWIMGLAVKVICYTRVIEIYLRAAYAPIALSDFFQNGMNGSGWRFLKNFMAVCLQGAIILTIAVIYSTAFSAVFRTLIESESNLFEFIGIWLAFMCSAVMLMFKSLSLSKEFVGTGG